MKLRSGLLLAFLLLFSVAVVKANTVPPGDPDVEVGGGSTSTPILTQTFLIAVGQNNCTITAHNSTNSYFCFDGENLSGVTFHNLLLTFPNAFTTEPSTTCGVQPSGFNSVFGNCTVNFPNHSMFFFGGTGITSTNSTSGHFVVAFLGFTPGTIVTAQANVPEPGTLTLFAVGIGALAARRRLRKG